MVESNVGQIRVCYDTGATLDFVNSSIWNKLEKYKVPQKITIFTEVKATKRFKKSV